MFTLDQVVPWGRSFDEYVRMFDLGPRELSQRLLDCAGGPASFNAEATRRAISVTSCDPIYRFDADTIAGRIDVTSEQILQQTRRNKDEFVWTDIPTIDALGERRHTAMRAFLEDFPAGRREGRYVDGELPQLPFADREFDLAVCSHFLFLYTTQLGDVFHIDAVLELCRVADEVRIFPLLALGAIGSPHVAAVLAALCARGHAATVERVPYEFQRGGNEMLKIRAR